MSLESVSHRTLFGRMGIASLAILSAALLIPTGCVDHSVNLDEAQTAYFSMGVSFPEEASSQLAAVDAWRVQVLRPGEGVVAEDAGAVTPEQITVTIELTVTLQASCEFLTIMTEVSSNGEVLFRSEAPTEICAGSGNGVFAQTLQWVGPVLGLSSTGLSFSLEEGGAPLTQTLIVSNLGGGTLNWSAVEDRWWLDISPTSGSLGTGQFEEIQVTVSDLDLSGGQYQGIITVSDPNALASPQTTSVTLNYTQKPRIGLSASGLTFMADEGIDSESKTLQITNVGGGTLNWDAGGEAGWMNFSPSNGSLGPGESQDLTVWASPGALLGGTYNSNLTLTDPNAVNSPRTVTVGLTVVSRPVIGLEPSGLSFNTVVGQDPNSQLLTIRNQGGQTLNWTASVGGGGWLGLSGNEGSLGSGQAQEVTVWANTANAGLEPGVYLASITVSDPFAMNSPQVVPVTLTVTQGPSIGLSTTVVTFAMYTGENPFDKQVTISNAGGGVLEWQATENVAWMGIEPTSGVLGTIGGVGLAQTMTISLGASDLKQGDYQGIITISDPDADNSPRTIQVNLSVRDRVPPVLSNFNINLTKLNDPTCLNPQGAGSRFRAIFNYSDTNGDILISNNSFVGNPVEVTSGFPEGVNTIVNKTADVEGDGYGGQAGFDLCIYFWEWSSANVWVRLEDSGQLMSNQLFQTIKRPAGANAPTQGSGSQDSTGVPGSASVLISGRSGG